MILLIVLLLAQTIYASNDHIEQKVDDLISKLTLDEKLDMIHGDGFNIAAVKRLGISAINVSDASMGLRVTPWPKVKGYELSTAFPASILLAATWKPEQAYDYSQAIAREFRARHMHVLLGPGINIYRSSLCGRNFEYMGEDPYLASRMVVPYVKGAQDIGVTTVVKHFVANNSENNRKSSNSVVSERALREIYFPAFKASVMSGDALGMMCSYNLVNGVYTGESSWLLKDVLRKEWGFRGFVISDWTSIWNSELAANSGMDLEMPGGPQTKVLAPKVMKEMLKTGKVTLAEIDDKVRNLIRPSIILDQYRNDWVKPEWNTHEQHQIVALNTAREGITLLKNEQQLLPFESSKDKKVVIIGPTSAKTPTSGHGSGAVNPIDPISLKAGMESLYPNITHLENFDADVVKSADLVLVCVGLNSEYVMRSYGTLGSIKEEQEYFSKANKGKDLEGEAKDRTRYGLPKSHDELILKCTAVNHNVAVAITAGSGVDMRKWVNEVESILWMYYPGVNGSLAAAEIIAGKTNPSGKLPMSIEKRIEDSAAFGNTGIGWRNEAPPKMAGIRKYWDVHYKEDIFVGYRHFDTHDIEPMFPFGHGLSYSTFTYSDLKLENSGDFPVKVSFTIKNTSQRDGKEIAQLYVGDKTSSHPRPVKELKNFEKISLKAGESKYITMELPKSAFQYWSPDVKDWHLENGEFDIMIGSSSRDIKLSQSLNIGE